MAPTRSKLTTSTVQNKRTILLISATNLLKNIKSRHLMGTIVLIVRYFFIKYKILEFANIKNDHACWFFLNYNHINLIILRNV